MTEVRTYTPDRPLKIGTRRSPLALAQAHMVADALRKTLFLAEDAVVLVPMLASGDKVQDRPLAEIGGKALWTKELEHALLEEIIDLAVHSMKDVETLRNDSFQIAAMLPRADVRDRLVGADSITGLPNAARLGTSSPRRAAQLLALRPDLQIVPLRGNVATRLGRIADGQADATLLAAAGLARLGMADTGNAIAIEDILPAASQGAIGIDILSNRVELAAALDPINHHETYKCVMAERAFLEAVCGDCHSPVAALAQMQDQELHLRTEILSEDGQEQQKGELRFDIGDHDGPARLAAMLFQRASPGLRALFAR